MPDPTDPASSLLLPAHPKHLTTARVFAAALGRHVGASADRVEDLRMAVSEACTHLLTTVRTAPSMAVSITPSSVGLAVSVRAEAGGTTSSHANGALADAPQVPAPDAEEGWGIELLRNLVEALAVHDDGEIRAISFVLPIQ